MSDSRTSDSDKILYLSVKIVSNDQIILSSAESQQKSNIIDSFLSLMRNSTISVCQKLCNFFFCSLECCSPDN